jgi:hypothetical protein
MRAALPSPCIQATKHQQRTAAAGFMRSDSASQARSTRLKQNASGFDRPIALDLLFGNGQAAFDRPANFAIIGDVAPRSIQYLTTAGRTTRRDHGRGLGLRGGPCPWPSRSDRRAMHDFLRSTGAYDVRDRSFG